MTSDPQHKSTDMSAVCIFQLLKSRTLSYSSMCIYIYISIYIYTLQSIYLAGYNGTPYTY